MVGSVASVLGYQPTKHKEQTKRWFHEGKLHENDIVQKFRDAHPELIVQEGHGVGNQMTQFQIQVPVPNTPLIIIGHIDGRVRGRLGTDNEGRWVPLEAKSVGEWTWTNKVTAHTDPAIEAWVKKDMPYAYQFTSYIAGLGATAGWYAVKDRNKGRYADVFMEAPLAIDAPIWRAQEIWSWIEKGMLPPCDGKCTSFDSQWWHCHERTPRPAPPPLSTDPAVVKAIEDYKNLTVQTKAAKQQQDDIKKQLRETLDEGKTTTPAGTVTVYSADNPKKVKRFSQDKAKKFLNEEQWEQCFEESEYPDAIDIR